MRGTIAFTITTLLLVSSSICPAAAQNKPAPSVQSQTGNETIGRDWKAKPGDDQQTGGNTTGKSPDSANQDSKKVDRDWRVEPGSDEKRR